MAKELYSRLGLQDTASESEIREAYAALTKDCDPKYGYDDAESLKRYESLTEAFTVLSDLNRRAEYDIRGTVSGRKKRRGSGSSLSSIVKLRENINRVFLCGAAASAVLFAVYLAGGSPVPFYYVCGISLVIKIVEYILRLVQ